METENSTRREGVFLTMRMRFVAYSSTCLLVALAVVGFLISKILEQKRVIHGHVLAQQAFAVSFHKLLHDAQPNTYSMLWVYNPADDACPSSSVTISGINLVPLYADPLHYSWVKNDDYINALWSFVMTYNYITLGEAISAVKHGGISPAVSNIFARAQILYRGSFEANLHSNLELYVQGNVSASNLFENVLYYATRGRGPLLEWYRIGGGSFEGTQWSRLYSDLTPD